MTPTSIYKDKTNTTYSNLPFQGGNDLSHHPHQVLVFVRVVREPYRLPDRQDLFANEPGMSGRSVEPTSLGGAITLGFSDRDQIWLPVATEGN